MKRKLYIAYGSNLSCEQMAIRCPTANVVGVSEIEDYELMFKGGKRSAVATIEKSKGSVVPVLVWDIGERDEKSLDIYEGYPGLYIKKDLEIKLNGKKVKAMVYVMTPNHNIGVPSDSYFKIIYDGYQKFNFDTDILDKAFEKSVNDGIENQEPSERQSLKWWW